MFTYSIEWLGRQYAGTGYPTRAAAQRARVERIKVLAERFPKGPRTVLVRAA